jgi:hypothetical protein
MSIKQAGRIPPDSPAIERCPRLRAMAAGGRIGPRAAPLGGAVNGPSPSPSGRTGLLAPRIQGSATTHARPGDRGQPGRGGDHIEHTNPLREAPRRQWEGATEVAYVLR